MSMCMALHSRDDINRQHMIRKERGTRLIRIEDCINTEKQDLEEYVNKCKEELITEASNRKNN